MKKIIAPPLVLLALWCGAHLLTWYKERHPEKTYTDIFASFTRRDEKAERFGQNLTEAFKDVQQNK